MGDTILGPNGICKKPEPLGGESPGPGLEEGHQSSPMMASQGWPASPGCYLQKQDSHFGKLKLQSEASLENPRQDGVVIDWILVPAHRF